MKNIGGFILFVVIVGTMYGLMIYDYYLAIRYGYFFIGGRGAGWVYYGKDTGSFFFFITLSLFLFAPPIIGFAVLLCRGMFRK